MVEFSTDNLRDYIDFLESLKNSVVGASEEAYRMIQHAHPNSQIMMQETGKFLALFGNSVIHTELTIMKMLLAEREYGRPAND